MACSIEPFLNLCDGQGAISHPLVSKVEIESEALSIVCLQIGNGRRRHTIYIMIVISEVILSKGHWYVFNKGCSLVNSFFHQLVWVEQLSIQPLDE